MANVKFNRGKTRANSITAAKTTDGYSTVYFPTDSATIVLGIGSTTDNREYGQAVQDTTGTERAFLLGHAVQGSIATTISNANVYMQEDKLYSNNSEVVNVTDAQTISGDKTFAGKIIKSGGTGDQVLAADGSVRAIESAITAGSDSLVTSGAVDVQIKVIDDRIAALEATGPSMNITWSELKALRDAGSLIPGMQYRITDYQCTTVLSGTKSAGHQFDIIVVADDESTLNETARAIKHPVTEGETDYFANNNLSAWQIWYCLDNNTTRFAWADSTNGKGVIYRMIDEFNNDVPYDFKNIQFYRQWDSNTSLWSAATFDNTGVPCYTFSSEGNSDTTSFTDTSLNKSVTIFDMVHSNAIKSCINPENGKNLYLNNNCFFGTGCGSNTFGNECFGNTFGSQCSGNTFGNNCYNNTFSTYCSHNTFGDTFHDNTFGSWCYGNTFSFGCSDITFGNDCHNNTFGSGCSDIKFASDKEATTKYTYYRNNRFGDNCGFIIFTGTGTGGEYAQVQNYNFAQRLQGAPRAYLTIDGVRNRSYETKVARNSEGTIKTYCEADLAQ